MCIREIDCELCIREIDCEMEEFPSDANTTLFPGQAFYISHCPTARDIKVYNSQVCSEQHTHDVAKKKKKRKKRDFQSSNEYNPILLSPKGGLLDFEEFWTLRTKL